jgi:hypothetical protein
MNVRGRIMSPHTVMRRIAEKQIALVNDSIIVFAAAKTRPVHPARGEETME